MFVLAQGIELLDIALIVLYLGAVAYLGWLGYRHTRTAADYLLAGRKVHPFIMAMSYGATFISTSAIVGFGGVAGWFGMSLLWLTFLNIFVGIFIAFVVLGGPTRRMGHRLDAHTFPELLGRRYDSRFIQVFAGLVIFLFMPLYAAAVLIGGTEFLATAFFNNNYTIALLVFAVLTAAYVFFGGLKGVLYTDALQGSIMVVGMLFLLISAYAAVGGVSQGHADLTAMKNQVPAGFAAIGHQGWTAMPKFGWGKPDYNLWWIVISTIVMGVGIGVLAQPQLVVRFLTVKSGRELHRALAIGGCFIFLMTGVAFTVGALSNVYFSKHEVLTGTLISTTERTDVIAKKDPGQAAKTLACRLIHLDTTGNGQADTTILDGVYAPPAPGAAPALKRIAKVETLENGKLRVRPNCNSFMRAIVPVGKDDKGQTIWMFNSDSIIPAYVTSAMPKWFKVIFLLTLLSAAMSTMSSQYHALGTAMGRDVFEQLFGRGKEGSARTIHVVRIGIIIGLVLAIVIGYQTRGGYFIARATSIFFGLCASTFLPSFIGGLYFRRFTRAGAIASMFVGFIVTGFWLLLVKEAEAGSIGLVRLLTGGPNSILWKHPNWPSVDPLIVALPLSVLAAIVVSLMSRPPAADHLMKCFGEAAVGKSEPVFQNA